MLVDTPHAGIMGLAESSQFPAVPPNKKYFDQKTKTNNKDKQLYITPLTAVFLSLRRFFVAFLKMSEIGVHISV